MKNNVKQYFDKNGLPLAAGDAVRISGAAFKCDNGYYLVSRVPGDPSWLGGDVSLIKIKRSGDLTVKGDHACRFWPLVSYCSNQKKNAAADAWNADNATIEKVDLPVAGRVDHFVALAEKNFDAAHWFELRGYAPSFYEREKVIATWAADIARRLAAAVRG